MTHEELENLLSEYLDEHLDPARRSAVKEHLSACAACRDVAANIRYAISACRSAGEVVPPPRLIYSIRRATTGETRTGTSRRFGKYPELAFQYRFVYGVAMIVFSLSLIANAAGLNLRNLRLKDLNPATWFYRANQASHLLAARAEKFYYDLRIVYEIESMIRDMQFQAPRENKQIKPPNGLPEAPESGIKSNSTELAFKAPEYAGPCAWRNQGVQADEMCKSPTQ